MKRVLLGLILALGLYSQAGAQVQTNSYVGVLRYDLDSAAVIYCKGAESFVRGVGLVVTVGSSTTVTTVGGATGGFSPLAVGDALVLGNSLRFVAAKASDNSITVDTAIDLTGGVGWGFIHFVCGSGAEDGWMPMAKFSEASVIVEINQQNTTTGIDVHLECRGASPDSLAVQVFPVCVIGACNTYTTVTTAGLAARTGYQVEFPWKECRVGMKLNSTDDGGDTGANAEQINVTLIGRQ